MTLKLQTPSMAWMMSGKHSNGGSICGARGSMRTAHSRVHSSRGAPKATARSSSGRLEPMAETSSHPY